MSLENMDTTEVAEDPIERFRQRYASKKDKSETTADRYATHLERWREWATERGKDYTDLADDVNARPEGADGVTAFDVADYLEAMTLSGYAENTANGAWAAVSTFYQTLRTFRQNPGDVDHDAFTDRSWSATTQIEEEERDPVKYLVPDDVRALVDHVPSPVPRNSLIVRILYTTGLRNGELCDLRVKDVDREEQVVNVWTQKAGDSRTVPYPDGLRQSLANWIDVSRGMVYGSEESDYLFPTRQSEQITGETVRYVVTTAAESAGLQEVYGTDVQGRERALVTPHTLRHSYAVQAAKDGMRAPFLRDLLGHHSIDITEVYLNIANDDAITAGRKHGPSI